MLCLPAQLLLTVPRYVCSRKLPSPARKRFSCVLFATQEYMRLRESVVQCEMILLRTLNFRVELDHPYLYLFHFCISLTSIGTCSLGHVYACVVYNITAFA
jgi:hypothetical protein